MRTATRLKVVLITTAGAFTLWTPEAAAAKPDPTCITACCICVDAVQCVQDPGTLCSDGCGPGSQPVTGQCRPDVECTGSLELLECTVV
jgi:hypothetical protein